MIRRRDFNRIAETLRAYAHKSGLRSPTPAEETLAQIEALLVDDGHLPEEDPQTETPAAESTGAR